MPERELPPGRYVPPDALLPAQLGLVALRHVTLGQLAATLVHLAQRGHLAIAEHRADGSRDWRLARTIPGSDALAQYELTLLDGILPADGPDAGASAAARTLSGLDDSVAAVLERVREELVRDAVHRGDLRRFHHDRRTPAGDRRATAIAAYRRDLRRLRNATGAAGLDACCAYAVLFALDDGDAERPEAAATTRQALADFAAAWVATCGHFVDWRPTPPVLDRGVDTWSRRQSGTLSGGTLSGGDIP